MWVIICAAYWVQYSTQDVATVDYNENSNIAARYSCGAPQSATVDEVLHYRSRDYAPIGVPSLKYIEILESDREEKAQKEAMEAAKPGSSETPKNQPEADREEPPAPKAPEDKEKPKDCKYWFTKIAPHTYKLWRKCPGKKPV